MTARTLDEIEALASDATPGLREVIDGSESAHCCFGTSIISRGQHDDHSILEILYGSDADANLIVNAPRLLAIAQEQRAEIERLREFVRDIRDEWDHDSSAHRYGTPCRSCEAEKLIGTKR